MATRSLPRQTRPTPPQRYPRGHSAIGPRPIPVDWQRAGAYWRQQTELKTAHLPTLGAMLAPEQNSFGVLRVAMALAVLVSHCFYLWYGTSTAEPLYKWTGYTLGQHGVQVFFFLSGVLVAQSLATSQSVRDYAIARGLRIFPALIACVLVTTLVLGVWLTTLDVKSYLNAREVAAYVLKTISLSTGSATLPGVFENTPVPGVVNSSLWTLKYEVLCYIMLAAVGFVAIQSKRPQMVAGIALAIWFLVMLQQRPQLLPSSPFSQVMLYFSLFFGSGVAAYALRDKIKLSGHLAMLFLLIAVWTNKTNFQEISLALALGYGSLWLATLRFGGLRDFTNHSDYSYGVYIYGVPVTQAILTLHPDMNLVSLIGFTLAGVFLAAFLSWELIEKPALRLKRVLSPRNASGAAYPIVSVHRRAVVQAGSMGGVAALQTDADVETDLDRSRAQIEAQVAKLRADRLEIAARQANAQSSRLKAEELAELRTRLALRRSATARPNGRGHG
ncbi:MAG: acyltransferase [Hyphomicrobiaceae bacterium]|nr:acyltransferase [Hyphomicrobiaceae bacterium]